MKRGMFYGEGKETTITAIIGAGLNMCIAVRPNTMLSLPTVGEPVELRCIDTGRVYRGRITRMLSAAEYVEWATEVRSKVPMFKHVPSISTEGAFEVHVD